MRNTGAFNLEYLVKLSFPKVSIVNLLIKGATPEVKQRDSKTILDLDNGQISISSFSEYGKILSNLFC